MNPAQETPDGWPRGDPKFIAPDQGNFNFAPDSPAAEDGGCPEGEWSGGPVVYLAGGGQWGDGANGIMGQESRPNNNNLNLVGYTAYNIVEVQTEDLDALGDGRGRELQRVGDGGDRAARVQLVQETEPVEIEHA